MTPTLHGTCPVCRAAVALRADGLVLRHTHASKVCAGSRKEPVAGSALAWLRAQRDDARAQLAALPTRRAKLVVQHARHLTELDTQAREERARLDWATRQLLGAS